MTMEKVFGIALICLLGTQSVRSSLPRLPESLNGTDEFVRREDDDRIVGGLIAARNEIPYQASLQIRATNGVFHHFCGGSVISSTCVVTAAHCADGHVPNNLYVVAGTNSFQKSVPLAVKEIQVNPTYSSWDVTNDIAVIKLAEPIEFSEALKPIMLPGEYKFQTNPGTLTVVSGWGAIKEGGTLSNNLLYTEVPIISDDDCRSSYGKAEIADSMICAGSSAGGKDSCQGDSGGPLAAWNGPNATLVGIVSWGYGCARPEYPGVYTEVSYFLDFLKSVQCL